MRFGSGEARLTGLLRTDGIVRALGGLFGGQFTTTQRDAITSTLRPYGVVIFNTTTNRYEINLGTEATPQWAAIQIGQYATATSSGVTVSGSNHVVLDFGTVLYDGISEIEMRLNIPFVSLFTGTQCQLKVTDFQTGSDVLLTRVAFWKNDGGEFWFPSHVAYRFTPSAGNHRYRFLADKVSGTSAVISAIDSALIHGSIVRSR